VSSTILRAGLNGGGLDQIGQHAGGAYVPTVFVGMYATQGRSKVRVSKLKHYYGLHHLHHLTTSTYRRARLFNSERFRKQGVATFGELIGNWITCTTIP
jgi:hypothetical protein